NHYLKINHEVLDKYEKWEGVINKDIVDFSPNRKYDLILSISTLEHIGLDEVPSNPEKTLPAIKKMESLLSKNGKLFFTIPWYHNEYLKKIIMEDKIKLRKAYFMIKLKNGFWKQLSYKKFLKDEKKINDKICKDDILFVGEI
nr:hypothetical protein [Bacteroidales bacterium]